MDLNACAKPRAGSTILLQDHQFLFNTGVSFIFGPGTVISKSTIDILEQLIRKN